MWEFILELTIAPLGVKLDVPNAESRVCAEGIGIGVLNLWTIDLSTQCNVTIDGTSLLADHKIDPFPYFLYIVPHKPIAAIKERPRTQWRRNTILCYMYVRTCSQVTADWIVWSHENKSWKIRSIIASPTAQYVRQLPTIRYMWTSQIVHGFLLGFIQYGNQ